MQVLKMILMIIYFIVCFALIVLAMMQSKEDAGLSSTITGSSSNNFYVKSYYGVVLRIASVGTKLGLSTIRNIPETGWVSEISVSPGTGYVVKITENEKSVYMRLYVKEWIESTEGGIIGAVVRYEDNWKIEE